MFHVLPPFLQWGCLRGKTALVETMRRPVDLDMFNEAASWPQVSVIRLESAHHLRQLHVPINDSIVSQPVNHAATKMRHPNKVEALLGESPIRLRKVDWSLKHAIRYTVRRRLICDKIDSDHINIRVRLGHLIRPDTSAATYVECL